ncbi:MAG: wax ester/triacylglycerol synthase domain-containing protein [Ilumatobacteraceae bacterium]
MTRRYLSQTDTIMWTVEADPMLRSTIMGVAMLARAPRWKATQQRVRHLIDRVESLRQRVVPVPMRPNSLRWEDVDHVDLDYHLRRVPARPARAPPATCSIWPGPSPPSPSTGPGRCGSSPWWTGSMAVARRC